MTKFFDSDLGIVVICATYQALGGLIVPLQIIILMALFTILLIVITRL